MYIICLFGSFGIGMLLSVHWNDPVPSGSVLPVLSGALIEGEAKMQKRTENIISSLRNQEFFERAIPIFGQKGGARNVTSFLFALSDTDFANPKTFFTIGIPCFSLSLTKKTKASETSRDQANIESERGTDPGLSPEPDGIPSRQIRDPELHASVLRDKGQGPEDGSLPESDLRISTEKGLRQEPLVAIYHSHSSEAYRLTSGVDHLWGSEEGIIYIGSKLALALQDNHGIPVLHSKRIHDYPVWREAYTRSEKTILGILEANKSIQIVLDVHRDAGLPVSVCPPTVEIKGVKTARILIVVTTDNYGLPHPGWRNNLSFAYQLNKELDKICPGLSRGVSVRNDARWNQHVHPRAVIVEIGSDKTKREEAEASTVYIAEAISRILQGLES
ncbi:MAG: stage II sporulation protein P [Firmicutes bacterium]|nr:stage II sporulation protein P [Bacillota bacterium]